MRVETPWLLLALLALLPTVPGSAEGPGPQTLESGGRQRTYSLHAPKDLDPDRPVPLVLLLHGSGRDGKSLVDPWSRLADKEGFLIAGPSSLDPRVWATPADGPELLRDLVEHLAQRYPVDRQRIYLFGHSAGGHFALQMALLESEVFAAAAVHAGAIYEDDDWLMDRARRKIPLRLVIGSEDPVVAPFWVRETAAALEARGFPTELVEIPGHDHGYYRLAPKINRQAWEFLKQHRLPAEPRWQTHRLR